MTKAVQNDQDGFTLQLVNTKMCIFFQNGSCTRGSSCTFAHDIQSLRQKPNLCKTQLCTAFMKTGVCPAGWSCNFAHGKDEKRRRTRNPAQVNEMLEPRFMAIKTQGNEMPKSSGTVIPAPPTHQLRCQSLYEVHDAVPQPMASNSQEKCVDMETSSDASMSSYASSNMTMPSCRQPSEVSDELVSQPAALPFQEQSWEDLGIIAKNTFIEVRAHAAEQRLIRRCISAPSIF